MSAGLAPPPKSVLGRHRLLAPTASVFVSPLCLGAMNFGEAWKSFLGECSKETAFEMLDYFYEQGGNFIDTAVNYQAGESEQWLGEWMQKHGRRNEVVLATKYTGPFNHALGTSVHQSNYGGTGSKSMYVSLESSLKNLQTDYIDLVRNRHGISWFWANCCHAVLRARLGLYNWYPRVDAILEPSRPTTEGTVPRSQ